MRGAFACCLMVSSGLLWACGSAFSASEGGGGTTTGTGGTGTGGSTGGQAGSGGSGGDSSCGDGLQFVPAVPIDWNGPMLLAVNSSPGVPDCPTGSANEGVVMIGIVASAASCSCNCEPPDPSECSATVEVFGASLCQGTVETSVTIPDDGCASTAVGFTAGSLRVTAEPPPGTTCAATAGNVSLPPVGWDEYARVCSQDWQSCMEPPPGSFEDTFCITKAGDQSCPTGAYSERTVYYAGVDDQRGCANDCSCSPSGVTCTGHIRIYDAPSCPTANEPPPQGLGCHTTDDLPQSVKYEAQTNGSCTPGTATPSGEATPTGAYTVCCIP